MSKKLTALRLGDGQLSPWPWNPGDVVETQGMKPVGKKDFEGNGIVAGKWSCNAGKVAINGHPVDEACFVISGNVTITDDEGHAQTFRAGEAFLLVELVAQIPEKLEEELEVDQRRRAVRLGLGE